MAQVTESKRTTLYNREGGSDKEYSLWLEGEGDSYLVNFQFGRRGGTQQTGTKTKAEVTLVEAEKIYAKILAEKKGKGYVEGQMSAAYSQTVGVTDSGLRPMLLTPDVEEKLDVYIKSLNWAAQEKMNGIRLLLRVKDEKAEGVNKKGLVRPIPKELETAMEGPDLVLDGELIGSVFYAFDLLEYKGANLRQDPLEDRHKKLEKLIEGLNTATVRLVPLIKSEKAKRNLVHQLRTARKEGVVFKEIMGEYEPGKRENLKKAMAVKIKFYKEADLTVRGWNKDTASVEVLAADGTSVGNVTIPEKYTSQIKSGAILRVRYLFATDANQLYQPKVDPTDDGQVTRTDGDVTKVGDLVHEGKDE